MPIFQEHPKGKLTKLNSFSVAKEKDIQILVEDNLLEVLDMHFLASEYTTTSGGRIDTLAVDTNGAPVIIEYKKHKSDNIINQGLSYLKWLQAQKVEFFERLVSIKLGEKLANTIKIDWKNPRVVCIAEAYNKFDIDTVEVIPMRIELFKYRYYDSGIFSLEPLGITEPTVKSNNSITEIQQQTADNHSVDSHLQRATPNIQELFEELRSRIFAIDENIIEKATSLYIAYRVARNFAEIFIGQNHLKIHLRPVEYNDPLAMIDKIPDSYQWTTNRRIYLKDKSELDYVFAIIEASYNDVI